MYTIAKSYHCRYGEKIVRIFLVGRVGRKFNFFRFYTCIVFLVYVLRKNIIRYYVFCAQ